MTILQRTLPVEILAEIFSNIQNDASLGVYARIKVLKTCRLVCRLFDDIVTPLLYRQVPFKGPHAFANFLQELRDDNERGEWVRNLDFSAFTSVGLGRSLACNTRIFLLTASNLAECLKLCRNVEEVFLSEALEADIDEHVLQTVFSLPRIKALDMCAADSNEFVESCMAFTRSAPTNWTCKLVNLSLHNCSTLPPAFYHDFLNHFPNLQKLDLYNTLVTDDALLSIRETCKLTSLNLSQCTRLSATCLYKFITSPVCRTLQDLKLLYSWNKTHPLSQSRPKLDRLLCALPRDMQILDIGGIELDMTHLTFMPSGLLELGAHAISIEGTPETLHPILFNLKYLLLTNNVIEISRIVPALALLFPSLAVLESPGLSKLHLRSSVDWNKLEGAGRRDWMQRRDVAGDGIESLGTQYHPRKSNMSLTMGGPRGLYEYYSYRV